MNTALRAAAIVTRLRAYSHALKRGVFATVAVLRRGLQAFVGAVRARVIVFASLQDAAARVAALQNQVAAAQERFAAYQAQERLLARSIHDGEAAASELTEAATACAEETMIRTRATTDAIMGRAKETAAATLREARAAADETLRAARMWIDATLEDARATVQREADAMEQDTAARIEPFMAAADRFAAAARATVEEMEGRVQTAATELSAKIARFETERDEYSRGLAALIERHAETLERVKHVQADVQERLVPALNRLNAGLERSDTSWLRSSPDKKSRGGEKGAGQQQGQARPMPPSPIGSETQGPPRLLGEVIVNGVNSFHAVKKFVRALSDVDGVETVRLLTYADGVATIGVSTEGPLAGLDVKHLDGIPVEVVDTTPTRLVVRLTRPSYPSVSG